MNIDDTGKFDIESIRHLMGTLIPCILWNEIGEGWRGNNEYATITLERHIYLYLKNIGKPFISARGGCERIFVSIFLRSIMIITIIVIIILCSSMYTYFYT